MSHNLAPNIQRPFESLLDRIGLWTVYTRSDYRFRCRLCFDLDTREARADCEACFGTGYRVTLERWKVYYTQSLRRATSVDEPLEIPGWATENKPYIISRKQDIPRIGDYFFIVEWNQPRDKITTLGGQPVRILQALRVLFVDPQIAGEVCYNISTCEFVTEKAWAFTRNLLTTPITVSRE